ncbi:MAG: helix-turn-helix domain-containing protein [Acidobacteria bacterium]|nr:helix-turn-helix domain-containing protein [Acidobacteriota bacterium]MCW5950443.1 helix-turn-helix domain-containing protein [Pyrinomonadaceae bacterium]
MADTLGEKLRQAREERGISIAEVAEQTRISPHYLESIENDNYDPLPGGIFNKGFIKAYAKYVGIDEQEAISDYSRQVSNSEIPPVEEKLPIYKPEVLTDDHSSRSMVPTVVAAVAILALASAGIYFGLNYLNQPSVTTSSTGSGSGANSNSASANTDTRPQTQPDVDMTQMKVTVTAVGQPVRMTGIKDEEKIDQLIKPEAPVTYEPAKALTLNYNRWNASAVQLSINGKAITLPGAPLDPKDGGRIIFTIDRDNIGKIISAGAISNEVAPAQPAAENANVPAAVPPPNRQAVTPKPAASAAPADAAPSGSPEMRPAGTPRPTPAAAKTPAVSARPAANGPAERPN